MDLKGFVEEVKKVLEGIDEFEGERDKKGVVVDDKEWELSVDPFPESEEEDKVIDYDEDGDVDEDDIEYHEELMLEEAEELEEEDEDEEDEEDDDEDDDEAEEDDEEEDDDEEDDDEEDDDNDEEDDDNDEEDDDDDDEEDDEEEEDDDDEEDDDEEDDEEEEEEEDDDEEDDDEEDDEEEDDDEKEENKVENKMIEEAQHAQEQGRNFSIIINNSTYYLTDDIENTPISEILEIGKAEAQKMIKQFPELNELKKNISTLTTSLGEYVVNLTNKYEIYNKQNEHEINKINLIILQQLQTQLEGELQNIQKSIKTEKEKVENFDLELEDFSNKLPQKSSICNMLTTCSSCVADPHCGWCASSNQCIEGDEHSSIFGKCSFYNFNKCSENSDCNYNDCNDCLGDAGCGWCNNVNPVCIKKDEAESGLCRINLFYHVWKDSNNKCPEINVYNFLDYIDNKLEEYSEVVIPDGIVIIDVPKREDVVEKMERINEEKINSTIVIDRFMKKYEDTMEQLKDVEEEEIKLNVMCGWNDTIQREGKID
jgi:hypothetical protein